MSAAIRVARAPDGALRYTLSLAPAALPPVTPKALQAAWDTARDSIRAAERRRLPGPYHNGPDPIWPDVNQPRWGTPRLLQFLPVEGEPTEIAIADRDASAWAEAIDSAFGLDSLLGMTLCLRMLALVEALTRLPWLAPLVSLGSGSLRLHPSLLEAAAALPLDAGARFDDDGLKRHLARPLPSAPNRSRQPGRIAGRPPA